MQWLNGRDPLHAQRDGRIQSKTFLNDRGEIREMFHLSIRWGLTRIGNCVNEFRSQLLQYIDIGEKMIRDGRKRVS